MSYFYYIYPTPLHTQYAEAPVHLAEGTPRYNIFTRFSVWDTSGAGTRTREIPGLMHVGVSEWKCVSVPEILKIQRRRTRWGLNCQNIRAIPGLHYFEFSELSDNSYYSE